MLTFANLIGVNLAGAATFLVQGVRPNRCWEARRAGLPADRRPPTLPGVPPVRAA